MNDISYTHMKIQTNFYTITPYSNLLIVKSISSWDDRIAAEHIEDIRKIILELYQNKPWGLLSDRREWQLNTPEAERLFVKMPKTVLSGTLTHSAIVVGKSELKKWQVHNMIKGASMYETKVFERIKKAEAWLASHGYNLT